MKIYIKEYDTILETDDIVAAVPFCEDSRAKVLVTTKTPIFIAGGDPTCYIAIVTTSSTRACDIVENISEIMGAKKI